MEGFFFSILAFLLNLLVEMVVYLVVDSFFKRPIYAARDAEEKQWLWLVECAVLLCIALPVYATHHFPYLLVFMIGTTFVCTNGSLILSISNCWRSVKVSWEEFKEHEESIGQQQQQQNQQVDASIQINGQANVPLAPGAQNFPMQFSYKPPTAEDVHAAPSPSRLLVRRPLNSKPHDVPESQPIQPSNTFGRSINRVHDAVSAMFGGRARKAEDLAPPGLHNNGRNICFLNASMQALAWTPTLPSALVDIASVRPLRRQYLVKLIDLLETMITVPTKSTPVALNTEAFRVAASDDTPLIKNPMSGYRQMQQDAAECLTWMLDALHGELNESLAVNGAGGGHERVNGFALVDSANQSPRHFTPMILQQLKSKYNHPTADQIRCAYATAVNEVQVNSSAGLNIPVVQRNICAISELDWMSHHYSHNSVIDDLFSGQLVDARLCDACRRLSLTTQWFHILPLALVRPKDLSGIVSLNDCFARFTREEHLGGVNGLQCDYCNRSVNMDPASVMSPLGNHLAPMSPIGAAGGSSTMSDGSPRNIEYRTSTPIPPMSRPLRTHLTNFQRRTVIGFPPSCLVVQLMRFSMDVNSCSKKVCLPVSIPLTGLDLSDLLLSKFVSSTSMLKATYNLYAVVLHLGSDTTGNGHYVTYARCDSTWYYFDDEIVRSVNMDYELTTHKVRENAYLLFFERVL